MDAPETVKEETEMVGGSPSQKLSGKAEASAAKKEEHPKLT